MSERNNKLELLGSAPIPKALMALGIPIMIGMLINALYNLVDGGCEMTVYLPKDSTAADKWSEKDYLYQLGLEADKQEWDSREVSLSMPKFEMEYGKELKDILKELGLEGIFDGCIYDRLTDAEMAVGSIYHKTAIKNDENGTEAAAVTMMLMEAMALLPEDDIVEMNMDHPFYFTISNTETGLKLFEGCVYNLK